MQFRPASLKIAEIRRGSDGVKYINYINTGSHQAGLFPVANSLLQFIYQPASRRVADGMTVLMATVGYRPVRGLQSNSDCRC